jgi:DNA-binding beta-propeller fold protein YncE
MWLRCFISGLLLAGVLGVLGGLGLEAQEEQEPLTGYATGPDRVFILDLDEFKRVRTVIGGEEVQFLSTPPKFGPEGLLYIGDHDSGGLHIFDPQAQEFKGFIPIEGQPNDFEILGDKALVNDFPNRRVQILDLLTQEVLGSAAVDGPAANEIAVSPDGTRAYVTTFNYEESIPHEVSHPLVVFEVIFQDGVLRLEHLKTIPLSEELDGQAIPYMASSVDVSSDGKLVYVLAPDDFEENPAIFIIDALSLEVVELITIDLGRRARAPFVNILVLSPDDRMLAVAAFENGLVLLDLQTRESRILKPEGERLIGASTFGATFGPEGLIVYAIGNVGAPMGFLAGFDPKAGKQLGVITFRRQPLLYMGVPGGKTF